MRRSAVLVMLLLLAGCSGSGASPVATTRSASGTPGLPGVSLGTVPTPASTGGLPGFGPQTRASGARFRVMNAYAPLNVAPGPVDVYSGFSAAADQQPIVTVPYGAISDWFDPGVFDEQGDANVVYYPAGRKGQEDQLMSKSETLKGTEQITAFLTTGSYKAPSGANLGQLTENFEKGSQGGFASPVPGKANVLTFSSGLDNTMSKKDRTWFLSAGNGCLSRPDPAQYEGPQPVDSGNGVLSVDPTATKLTLHEYTGDLTSVAFECKSTPILEIPVSLTVGGQGYVFLFSPGKDEVRALFAPIP